MIFSRIFYKFTMKQVGLQACAARGKEGAVTLLFVIGIYFLARGVFALYGQTIFYTKRNLESIATEDLPAYLKEIGRIHLAVGTIFVGKAILDVPFPDSRPIFYGWLLALLVCVFFLSKIDTKYKKQ